MEVAGRERKTSSEIIKELYVNNINWINLAYHTIIRENLCSQIFEFEK